MYADYKKDYKKLDRLLIDYYKKYMYDARHILENNDTERKLSIQDMRKRLANDYPIIGRALHVSIENLCSIAEANHTIMNDEYYFCADIAVFPIFRGYTLFITYSDSFTGLFDTMLSNKNNNPIYTEFVSKYGIKDYHFQNQTDKPDSISEYCWNKRDEDWNKCLEHGVPSLNGMCINIMDTNMFFMKKRFSETRNEIVFASKDERIKKLAKTKILEEYYEEYGKTCDSNKSVFSIYYEAEKVFKQELKDENSELSIRVAKKEKELENVIIDIDKETLVKDIAFFIPNYCDLIKRGDLNNE